jgi:CheY-like chemotaxis protein
MGIIKVVSRLLELNGHIVATASNGSRGLEQLKKAHENKEFDMVLTDLQMPVMDGLEATSRYRQFEEDRDRGNEHDTGINRSFNPRMLIIGMSANSGNEYKKNALQSGMDYFFAKPFKYKDMEPILLDRFPDRFTKSS